MIIWNTNVKHVLVVLLFVIYQSNYCGYWKIKISLLFFKRELLGFWIIGELVIRDEGFKTAEWLGNWNIRKIKAHLTKVEKKKQTKLS